MRIRIDLESDFFIDGLFVHITENQKVKVYQSFRDIDEGIEITDQVKLLYQLHCPACESWIDFENWTEKYICSNCAWDSLETEAYGELLSDNQ